MEWEERKVDFSPLGRKTDSVLSFFSRRNSSKTKFCAQLFCFDVPNPHLSPTVVKRKNKIFWCQMWGEKVFKKGLNVFSAIRGRCQVQ